MVSFSHEVGEIRRLLEAILMLGSARGAGLIVTLVRQKVLSIYLGPTGMGLLGLLRRFLDPLREILPLGVNSGVVKLVSQTLSAEDEQGVRRITATAAWFFLAVSSAATLAILIFSRALAVRVLGEQTYRHLIVLAALSLPLTIFAGYFNALLVGAQKIGTITRIHYVGHAVTLVISIPLIVFFRLTGAVVGLLLLEAFYCGAFGLMAARHVPVGLRSFRLGQLGRLSSYGLATLADGGLWMLVFFLAFADFSDRFGKDTLGLYEIISRLSFNYVAVLLFVINSYVFPRLASFENDREAIGETNTALRGIWFLMVPSAVVLSVVIKPVIWIFSTPEFYDGAAFLPWQLVGDLFFLSWIILGWALLARGRLFAYVTAAVARNITFVVAYLTLRILSGRVSLNLFPSMIPAESLRGFSGWQGLIWAYAASGAVSAALAYGVLKRLYGFGLERRNWLLIGYSSAVMLPVLFVPNLGPIWIGAKFAALVLWMVIVVRKSEWVEAFRWINGLLSRK